MNIFIICIEMLKKKDFKKAFIEKNGLYDFGVSIIHAINCFCNLIINTNKIHDLYLMILQNCYLNSLKLKMFSWKLLIKKLIIIILC